MPAKWVVDPSLAFDEFVDAYSQHVFKEGRLVAQKTAEEMEAWAKANAPWQDRTGNARAELRASVDDLGFAIARITLSHGVPYGIWLEVANGGKYSIITKTIDMFAPRLARNMQSIRNLRAKFK